MIKKMVGVQIFSYPRLAVALISLFKLLITLKNLIVLPEVLSAKRIFSLKTCNKFYQNHSSHKFITQFLFIWTTKIRIKLYPNLINFFSNIFPRKFSLCRRQSKKCQQATVIFKFSITFTAYLYP